LRNWKSFNSLLVRLNEMGFMMSLRLSIVSVIVLSLLTVGCSDSKPKIEEDDQHPIEEKQTEEEQEKLTQKEQESQVEEKGGAAQETDVDYLDIPYFDVTIEGLPDNREEWPFNGFSFITDGLEGLETDGVTFRLHRGSWEPDDEYGQWFVPQDGYFFEWRGEYHDPDPDLAEFNPLFPLRFRLHFYYDYWPGATGIPEGFYWKLDAFAGEIASSVGIWLPEEIKKDEDPSGYYGTELGDIVDPPIFEYENYKVLIQAAQDEPPSPTVVILTDAEKANDESAENESEDLKNTVVGIAKENH